MSITQEPIEYLPVQAGSDTPLFALPAEADVALMRAWAGRLEAMIVAQEGCSRIQARAVIHERHGITPSQLEHLSRDRAKDPSISLFRALQTAVAAEARVEARSASALATEAARARLDDPDIARGLRMVAAGRERIARALQRARGIEPKEV